jgi:arsenate reductase
MVRSAKPRVLFICTANACRSQMAEGWAKALRSDDFEAYSAGTTSAAVSGKALQVMAEAGVDISSHRSKRIDELAGIEFDLAVTLCDNARQQCPVVPAAKRLIHYPVEDPTFLPGSEQEVLDAFRKTRDHIRRFVEMLEVDA